MQDVKTLLSTEKCYIVVDSIQFEKEKNTVSPASWPALLFFNLGALTRTQGEGLLYEKRTNYTQRQHSKRDW